MGNTCLVLCALFRVDCCKWVGNLKKILNSMLLSLLCLITVTMWGMAYDVNFASMTQQNVKTSKVRSIRRGLKPNEAVFPKLGSRIFWLGNDAMRGTDTGSVCYLYLLWYVYIYIHNMYIYIYTYIYIHTHVWANAYAHVFTHWHVWFTVFGIIDLARIMTRNIHFHIFSHLIYTRV